MAVNRDNKFRNALEVFKQHCDSKDALLDAYLEKIIANTVSSSISITFTNIRILKSSFFLSLKHVIFKLNQKKKFVEEIIR